jgi:endonuclease YncB( thermonuclease family)
VFGKSIKVAVTDTDRYRRSVGDVYLGPAWINLAMVAEGWAWHYVQYSKAPELAAAEKTARGARRGLWADPAPVAPWLYRDKPKEEK